MVGKTILHYKILKKLGEGGMGIVYLAQDTKLERKVAIKFLPRHIARNSEERERFKIEAKAAASLSHPNIATIHAIEEFEDNYFIVMEYINGKELKEIISPLSQRGDKGGFPINDIINYATQIAEGLEAAHKKGIVHRDIKSQNIMVTEEGKVKIMDFGLAKVGKGSQVTKLGTTIGTIAYMSPEQTKGEEVDNQTDIWSFGIVLYEMLTGELPFKGEYDQAIIYSILNESPTFSKSNKNEFSIYEVVKKALEKEKNKRYKQMSEFINDLKLCKKGVFIGELKPAANEIKKLAILPFSNIIDDPQTNFLGFALADQIIGAMAYSKNVLVRPSSSIRKFQNEVIDLQTAGQDLKVKYILAGNYLKENNIIRLNIELVDLELEKMIWREPIQIEYKNAFELQDIVSQKVVDGLKVQFSEEEKNHMKPDIPRNPAAYEFYLRAVAYPHNLEGTKMAIEILNNSIDLDPSYAPAYMELGSRYNQLSQVGKGTAEAQNNSEKALLKALSIKNDFLPALAYLALVYTDIGKHEEAHSLLIKALEINPNHSWLHFSLSYHYRYIGFLDESLKEIEIALSIDPENPRFRSAVITYMFLGKYNEVLESFNLDADSPFTLNFLGEIAFRAGKKDISLEYFEKSLRVKDEIGEFYFASSFVEFMKGNLKEAAEFNYKREKEDPADSENWYEIARLYGLFNMKKECARALKKSIDMGYISYPSMQNDSFLDSVRNEPDIKKLLEEARTKHEDLKKKLTV